MKPFRIFFYFLAPLAFAQESVSLDSLLARLVESEKTIQTLGFDYTQNTEILLTHEKQTLKGTALFEKPDHFKLTLKGNQNQTVVSNGETLWIYNESRQQVTTDKWVNWSKTAGFPRGLAPFNMSVSELKKSYTLSLEKSSGSGPPVLRMEPKGGSPWPYVFRLWVNMETGLASKTELSSSSVLSVTTVKNVRVNPRIPQGAFVFQAPAGVDVFSLPDLGVAQ